MDVIGSSAKVISILRDVAGRLDAQETASD